MTGFVVILSALSLAAPVHCYQGQQSWSMQTRAEGIPADVLGYYDPVTRHIGLSPYGCQQVRRPTLEGANLLAHELAHVWQDDNNRTFDEREANRIARWAERGLLARLVSVWGRRAAVAPSPDNPVVLP